MKVAAYALVILIDLGLFLWALVAGSNLLSWFGMDRTLGVIVMACVMWVGARWRQWTLGVEKARREFDKEAER